MFDPWRSDIEGDEEERRWDVDRNEAAVGHSEQVVGRDGIGRDCNHER